MDNKCDCLVGFGYKVRLAGRITYLIRESEMKDWTFYKYFNYCPICGKNLKEKK